MSTWLPREQYIESIARATSYACLYFTDTDGRPVQLRSTHARERWQLPGGNMETGETPWQCALRECAEETGIAFEGEQRILAVHFVPPRPDWHPNHIGFVFDGGRLTDAQVRGIRLDPEEHTDIQVRSLAEWKRLMLPAGFTRLSALDRARRTGEVVYLEG